MQDTRRPEQEDAEDIFFGQLVIIWSRWFLILAGILMTFWTVTSSLELSISLLPIAALMLMNFFLHGRYVMERPANRLLIAITSLLDLVIISLIIYLWPDAKGLDNQLFIFYYPAVLGFSFVFSSRYAIAYTALALVAYAAICLLINPVILTDPIRLEVLVSRLITIAATGALATYYWRIQRNRRRAAIGNSAAV